MTNEEAIGLLEKARMDFTNGQGKLTDVMNAIRSGHVAVREPQPPAEHIRQMIRNGVVRDLIDLKAEYDGWELHDQALWDELAAMVTGPPPPVVPLAPGEEERGG